MKNLLKGCQSCAVDMVLFLCWVLGSLAGSFIFVMQQNMQDGQRIMIIGSYGFF